MVNYISILLLILIMSCGYSEKKEIVSEPLLSVNSATQKCIDVFSEQDWYMDRGFTCNEDQYDCLAIITDSATKKDLLHTYYRDDLGYGFKLFLFKNLYHKYIDIRKDLLTDGNGDTTLINHITSCIGIEYIRTYEEDCFLIARKYSPDSIDNIILKNHDNFSCYPQLLLNSRPLINNYEIIKHQTSVFPEAVLALSKFRQTEDTVLILDKLNTYWEESDTNSLIKILPILGKEVYLPWGKGDRAPYSHFYENIILDYKLYLSEKYRFSIPKIIYCYLDNIDKPFPKLETIILNLMDEYSKGKYDNYEKKDILLTLESIYAAFYNSLPLKNFKMHEKEIKVLEEFLIENNSDLTTLNQDYSYSSNFFDFL